MVDEFKADHIWSVDPATFTHAADLGRALRALKRRRGQSLRQLARASGLAYSTISGYCRGRHLPQQGLGSEFRALLRVLGVASEDDLDRWAVAVDRLRLTRAVA